MISDYLAEVRELVLTEIRSWIPSSPHLRQILYDLVLDYPLRDAKGLRPALVIAVSRALGADAYAAVPTAAAIELYHNAFLVHDDVEDGSVIRRNRPTLHQEHGHAIAVNVGDAMLALTLEPLLRNVRGIGLGPALRVIELIARMARESAEGQAMELTWIARGEIPARDAQYLRMVHKKTGWYTFVAPLLMGAIIGRASAPTQRSLARFAMPLGIAFQIQDDLLNLIGDPARVGKDASGDLWEGKRTLMIIHAFRRATLEQRADLARILGPRRTVSADITSVVEVAVARGWLAQDHADELLRERAAGARTAGDVARLRALIDGADAMGHAARVARRHVDAARRWYRR